MEDNSHHTQETEQQVSHLPAALNSSIPELDRAETLAKRIEEANKKTEELLIKQEQLAARIALSGRAEAGIGQEKPKEETPKEYKDRIMKGG